MATRIVVDLGYVGELKSSVDSTTGGLRSDGEHRASVPSTPRVDDALSDFLSKWDERRTELADSLDAVSSALGAISDSFSRTEDELVAQLNAG